MGLEAVRGGCGVGLIGLTGLTVVNWSILDDRRSDSMYSRSTLALFPNIACSSKEEAMAKASSLLNPKVVKTESKADCFNFMTIASVALLIAVIAAHWLNCEVIILL